MEKAYRNVPYVFVAVLLLVFIAFFKTYFGLFPQFVGTPALIHVHVFSVLLWFALLIVQPILIVRKQVALHRWLGKLSYGFVPVMVVLMILVMKAGQIHQKNMGIFAINSFDIGLFVALYGLAILYRRTPAYHARFMILTILPFLGPIFGRLPQLALPAGVVELLVIGGFLLYERFNRKLYKPYLIALAAFLGLFLPLLSLFIFGQNLLEALWTLCYG